MDLGLHYYQIVGKKQEQRERKRAPFLFFIPLDLIALMGRVGVEPSSFHPVLKEQKTTG